MARPGILGHRGLLRKSKEFTRVNLRTFIIGVFFGFLIGSFLPLASVNKRLFSSKISCTEDNNKSIKSTHIIQKHEGAPSNCQAETNLLSSNGTQIYVHTNPKGTERLPPGILESESDLYLRRLRGDPSKDLPTKEKYLVTFTVGHEQRKIIDAAVKKFRENFTILLFHYDGRINEWDEFEWSKQAIHVSARKQTKWWYAKRFLHPDIVAPYDYIFIWDEDLGVEHFDAEKYIKMVKKYKLEISQPGVQSPKQNVTWQMTKKRDDVEVHKETVARPERCSDPHLPPCAGFVEIMAPVFSRDAWRCVWHMIQNDLVHGWGLDFGFRRCVEPAHEKIGVVDSQWIVHHGIPSLGGQGQAGKGKSLRPKVRDRCFTEWQIFHDRMENAVKAYYNETGIKYPNRSSTLEDYKFAGQRT